MKPLKIMLLSLVMLFACTEKEEFDQTVDQMKSMNNTTITVSYTESQYALFFLEVFPPSAESYFTNGQTAYSSNGGGNTDEPITFQIPNGSTYKIYTSQFFYEGGVYHLKSMLKYSNHLTVQNLTFDWALNNPSLFSHEDSLGYINITSEFPFETMSNKEVNIDVYGTSYKIYPLFVDLYINLTSVPNELYATTEWVINENQFVTNVTDITINKSHFDFTYIEGYPNPIVIKVSNIQINHQKVREYVYFSNSPYGSVTSSFVSGSMINLGETVMFDIESDSIAFLRKILVNGNEIDITYITGLFEYTITEGTTFYFEFKRHPFITVNTVVNGSGTLTANYETPMYNTPVTFTATPNPNNFILKWVVNGVHVPNSNNTLTIEASPANSINGILNVMVVFRPIVKPQALHVLTEMNHL